MESNKKMHKKSLKADLSWRKPITLASFEEDEDPLAMLYQGREAGKIATENEVSSLKGKEKSPERATKEAKNVDVPQETVSVKKEVTEKLSQTGEKSTDSAAPATLTTGTTKISEAELKNILKIKNDSYYFTDLREILRGKSFEIYGYLRLLAGDTGVCKIKHLDLMKKLDISRPTLFKQGDWLIRLGLIEKSNVPGDHLGTSYKVYPLEEVLPVPVSLIAQLNLQIENYRQGLV